jgi:hypothetical protein
MTENHGNDRNEKASLRVVKLRETQAPVGILSDTIMNGLVYGKCPCIQFWDVSFFPAASFLQRPDPRLKPCVRPAYLQLWDPSHVADPTWVASFFIFELWACALQMQGPNIQMHPQNWSMIWEWTWHTLGESNMTMINPSYPIHLYQSSSMFD